MALFGYGSSGKDTLTRVLPWSSQGPRPWFYSCWLYMTNFGVQQSPFMLTSNAAVGTNNAPRAGLRSSGQTSFLGVDQDNGFASANISAVYTAPSGVWFHYAASHNASNHREYFLGGVSKGVSTNNLGVETLEVLQVGYGIGSPWASQNALAELVVGTGVLNGAQVALLNQGANPLAIFPPSQILSYYPLRGDANDYAPVGGVSLTPGGTNSSNAIAAGSASWAPIHPSVAPSRTRRLFKSASGPAGLFLSGRIGSSLGGRTFVDLGASLIGRTMSESKFIAPVGLIAPVKGTLIAGEGRGLASVGLTAPLTGKLIAAEGRGMAAPALGAPLQGVTRAGSQAQASPSLGMQLAAAARVGSAAAGKAAIGLATTLAGKIGIEGMGRAMPPALSAPLTGKMATGGKAQAAPGLLVSISGRMQTIGQGRMFGALAAFLTGRTRAQAGGSATPGLGISLIAKTASRATGRFLSPALGVMLTAKMGVVLMAQAVPGLGARLSGLARTGGASAGRAAFGLTTSITGRMSAESNGRLIAPGLGISLVAKTAAKAAGRATSNVGVVLSGLARVGAAATGRAASSLSAPLAGLISSRAGERASPALSASLAGRTSSKTSAQGGAAGLVSLTARAASRAAGRASAVGAAMLSATGRLGGAATGRAMSSLAAPLTGQMSTGGAASGITGLAISLLGRMAGLLGIQLGISAPPHRIAPPADEVPLARTAFVPASTRLAVVQKSNRVADGGEE